MFIKPSFSLLYFHGCIPSKSKLRLTGLFLVSLNANGISYIGCRAEGGSFRQTSRPAIVSKVRFILGLRDKKCNSIINMDDTVGNKYAHRAKRNIQQVSPTYVEGLEQQLLYTHIKIHLNNIIKIASVTILCNSCSPHKMYNVQRHIQCIFSLVSPLSDDIRPMLRFSRSFSNLPGLWV